VGRERGFSDRAVSEAEEFDKNPKRPIMYAVTESRLSRGSFPAVRATAVGRDAERNAVLAGDPKGIRLLCNTSLITNVPSRGSKEARIRIHLQVRPNIQNNGYKR